MKAIREVVGQDLQWKGKKVGLFAEDEFELPTTCATCTAFRHRHRRRSSLIETAKMKVTRREANQEIKKMKPRGYNRAEKEAVYCS